MKVCIRFIAAVFILVLSAVSALAQTTRVKGRVTDASTGEGVPFVAVYFEGTTIGVSSDLDGYYMLETRDANVRVLSAALLGYETASVEVVPRKFTEVNFRLKPVYDNLKAAIVKPDNRYMKWILRNIDAAKDRNNPELRDRYDCELYTKMELDITHPDDNIKKSTLLRKNFGFIFDYVDTSVVSGVPYLPVMMSETHSHIWHQRDPEMRHEEIHANRISGMEDQTVAAQFTGNLHMKVNFYNNYINIFDVEMPSPLSRVGLMYYNYFLIDSLHIDGRKTWKIRFHPVKSISSPAFDGEMSIDCKDFALREMHCKLKKGANVNWVRDLVVDQESRLVQDSIWFWKMDKIYADFSVVKKDSSKMISFLGTRQSEYSEPAFDGVKQPGVGLVSGNVQVAKDALDKDEAYWNAIRPYELTQKEQNIYHMVDSIKNVPLYHDIYNTIDMIINGYWKAGKLSYGPYAKVISFNPLEGVRLQGGIRTTKEFSRKVRLTAYAAYGFKDKAFKGGLTGEYFFSVAPMRKITATVKRDVVQLGRGSKGFAESSILSSIFSKPGARKLSPLNEYSISYEHEWNPSVTTLLSLEARRIFSNQFVPMVRPDGSDINSIGMNMLRMTNRFSWDETVTRGVFEKLYVATKYPIIIIDLSGSLKGIGENEYSFFRAEGSINYKLQLPPMGTSKITLSGGKIIGQVPYPFLKLHEGNGSYFFDKTAFSCMEYYEFASDTWITLFWEHNFKGFFLGKIPLLKRLQWRENFTLKAAYGTVNARNDGRMGKQSVFEAPMLFPAGMNTLDKPYVEMGVGISNILKIIRVDCFWRCTHRERENPVTGEMEPVNGRFVLNFGLELRF